ncbi:MAG: DUF503 domain-containing protein [Calditrichaeota bacterium]|nr:DUF503 domain-containing protein [Calditrichota bacterium]
MLVGICQIELHIPASHSLKSKRIVLKSLKKRIQNKFNVSIAEVDYNEKWQRSILGISIVANERRFIDQALSQIMNLVENNNDVEIIDHSTEII